MTARYDEQLDTFARGRSLVRLTPPVVNRRGATCDACGSDRPRVLHGLREPGTGRHVFVGQSCLDALTERGAVRSRSARARTEQAYEAELDRRFTEGQPPDESRPPAGPEAPESPESPAAPDTAVPGAMLLVAILRPGEWTALLELVGADRDACLVIPLGHDLPSLAGAVLPLDRLRDFAARAATHRGA